MSAAPFRPGQRVNVPGRYNRMIVQRVWRGRDVITERIDGMTVRTVLPGDWHVQAEFESGYGMYVGYAHEFKDGWT